MFLVFRVRPSKEEEKISSSEDISPGTDCGCAQSRRKHRLISEICVIIKNFVDVIRINASDTVNWKSVERKPSSTPQFRKRLSQLHDQGNACINTMLPSTKCHLPRNGGHTSPHVQLALKPQVFGSRRFFDEVVTYTFFVYIPV